MWYQRKLEPNIGCNYVKVIMPLWWYYDGAETVNASYMNGNPVKYIQTINNVYIEKYTLGKKSEEAKAPLAPE